MRYQYDSEVDSIQDELSTVDVEIARLQAKRESLHKSLMAAINRTEEITMQLGVNEKSICNSLYSPKPMLPESQSKTPFVN